MKKPVRLTDLTTHILNEIIRADANFQLNQQAAWDALDESMTQPGGINIVAGLSRQENLFVQEFSFEFNLVPDQENMIFTLVNKWLGIKRTGYLYRLAPDYETPDSRIHVRFIIRRDRSKSFHTELETESASPVKKEDIYVTGLSR